MDVQALKLKWHLHVSDSESYSCTTGPAHKWHFSMKVVVEQLKPYLSLCLRLVANHGFKKLGKYIFCCTDLLTKLKGESHSSWKFNPYLLYDTLQKNGSPHLVGTITIQCYLLEGRDIFHLNRWWKQRIHRSAQDVFLGYHFRFVYCLITFLHRLIKSGYNFFTCYK